MDHRCTRREALGRTLGGLGLLAFGGGLATGAPEGACSTTEVFLAAVAAGRLEEVRERLDADPGLRYVRGPEGRSAYAVALLAGHRAVGDLLVERGHRPDLVESLLTLDWERFDRLAAEAPGRINDDHPAGGPPMVVAARAGAGSRIWKVYAHGGLPEAPALLAAFDHPDLGTVEQTASALLGNGADPRIADASGRTPLHAAAARGSAVLVETLVRKGGVVGARDRNGRTARDLAVEREREAVLAVLDEEASIPRDHSTSRTARDVHGAPWRAPDLSAFSPAAVSGLVGSAHTDFERVRERVDRHPALACAAATTTEGAVEAGAHMGRGDIVDYLLERGAPYSLPTAVMRGDLDRVDAMLREDPLRIHERGPHDFALLWYPVIGGGTPASMRRLLEAGAEVERQHTLGATALHWAARAGRLDLVDLLMEHGADPARVSRRFDPAGETPLDMARRRGHDDVVDRLSRG